MIASATTVARETADRAPSSRQALPDALRTRPAPGPLVLRGMAKFSRILHPWAQSRLVNWFLKHAGVGAAPAIASFTTTTELEALFTLARNCPPGAAALEVGSHLGKSSCYLAAALALRGGKLLCVDTWHNETMPDGQRDTFEEFRRNTAGLGDRIVPLRMRSDQLAPEQVGTVHLIFLDGDHSYEAVSGDFERFSPHLADGGVIALHDCLHFAGVSRTIGEALASGRWAMGGSVSNLFWMHRASTT